MQDDATQRYRLELGERLAQVIDKFDTKSDAAAVAGVSVEQLNKWSRGSVKVPLEAVRALALAAEVDLIWVISGVDKSSSPARANPRDDQITKALRAIEEFAKSDPDAYGGLVLPRADLRKQIMRFASRDDEQLGDVVKLLPFYKDVQASAGHGAVAVSERHDSVIGFTYRFLRELGADPRQCSIIRASGDSMHPSIPDGSLLTVDHSQIDLRHGHIMVVSLGEDLLVKRVRRRLDGMIELKSDNPAYPPETIGSDWADQVRVVGRVVYFSRTP